jgi:probable HAF family extracellular repeat protein
MPGREPPPGRRATRRVPCCPFHDVKEHGLSSSRRRVRAGSALTVLAAAALLATPALTSSAQAATTPKYTVKIINSAPGTDLFGISNSGDVFGTAAESGAEGGSASFLLKAGSSTVQFLGTPGDQGNAISSSVALGINASHVVVGYTQSDQANNDVDVPVEWINSGTPTKVASLVYELGARATGINDGGEIVGFKEDLNAQGDKSFKLQGGTLTQLPVLPNGGVNADALGLSSNGFIAGDADSQASSRQAVEWSTSGAITALPQPAGTFVSQAFSVNASGVAVGDVVSGTDGKSHAVMWANGTVTDLAPGTVLGFGAVANSINNSGVIVGSGGNGRAFVYQNGTATDLNTLVAPTAGLTLTGAAGINSSGQIAGNATLNGAEVGYILTPVS